MITGKTKLGFEFEVEERTITDWRLLRKLAAVDKNPALIPELVDAILGEEQTSRLEDYHAEKDGFIDTNKMGEEIASIFSAVAELKNS